MSRFLVESIIRIILRMWGANEECKNQPYWLFLGVCRCFACVIDYSKLADIVRKNCHKVKNMIIIENNPRLYLKFSA